MSFGFQPVKRPAAIEALVICLVLGTLTFRRTLRNRHRNSGESHYSYPEGGLLLAQTWQHNVLDRFVLIRVHSWFKNGVFNKRAKSCGQTTVALN